MIRQVQQRLEYRRIDDELAIAPRANQPGMSQLLQVESKRVGSDPQGFAHLAGGQSVGTGTDKSAHDGKADRMRQGG